MVILWLYGRAIQSNHNVPQSGNEFDAKSMISLLRCARYSRDITSAKLRATISRANPSLSHSISFQRKRVAAQPLQRSDTSLWWLSASPRPQICLASEIAGKMSQFHIPPEIRCHRSEGPSSTSMIQML